MTRREIFFVANEVNELGGVGRWQTQMARLFAERGHRVRIIGICPPEMPMDLGEDPPFETVTLHARRPPGRRGPHLLPGRLDPVVRRQQARRRAAAARMSRMFRAARPGAVIIVTQVWAMEWVALADTAGHSVIGMSHESFDASRRSSRFARVRTYFRDVDRLLLLTRQDADLWAGQGLNNVGFLPNPLPVLPGVPSPRTEKVVASIGRLSHAKGVDLLLDVWAEAAPRQPGWLLRIHGAGDHEEELRRQCTRLGLDDSVEWAGQTDDVTGALARCSLLVQSSRGEGFPLVLLEAMACGVPCVAFDCSPGVREIVEDGEDGLLARHGNTTELAAHLVRLMADENLRDTMGERARRNVLRFAPEVITDRWEELFAFLER
ncbi:glycosyltransferase [Streptomyces nodosus]|uniref:D-inositol 3-phosphate glycosyltransferase n=1 Tax=Streptomyces nodosus TaxID=40318 RepID=A0A0B5DLQ8_9ACTN|nr:glycosyltransferase [Streptomyces nodosus]AJE44119.1 glycosyl transferase [Streptomyces nodosus]MBB4795713.1 glycosyltransferase involved in cell wall biosynthesis [Streptomyces nodosus]QEV42610.1 glycosyltransferase family 4 protein [Streptomyces nodosus]